MEEREKAEYFALCSIDGLGRAGILRLLEKAGSAGEALKLSEPALVCKYRKNDIKEVK